MIIKEIELHNFRIYKGSNNIDLSVSDSENIIIISGKNGYGKTTLLMSLVWCLYGKKMQDVDEIYKKEINNNGNYAKYIRNCINRQAESEEGETTFSVSVTFLDVNIFSDLPCKELKITRTYDIQTKKEPLEILIDGRKNELVTDAGEENFINDFIMPREIAKFFFFDAEKITSLAEIHTVEQRKNLSTAFSEVLGIKKYQILKEDLENYLRDLKKNNANKSEKEKLENVKSQNKIAGEDIVQIDKEISDLEEKETNLKYDIDKLQEKLIQKGNLITVEQLNNLKQDKEKLALEKSNLQKKLKSHYEMIPFAIAGNLLIQVFEQIVAERKCINTNFEEDKISKASNAIIDALTNTPKPKELFIRREIEDFYVKTFEKLIKKHLAPSEKNIEDITILHHYSESEKQELQKFINEIQSFFKHEFKTMNKEFIAIKNQIHERNKKIRIAEETSENPLVKEDRTRKQTLEKQQKQIWEKIGQLKNQKEQKNNLITKNKKEIDRISDTLEISKEKLKIGNAVEKTIIILKESIENFKKEKSESLSEKIKKGLDLLLHKKDFIKEVEVEITGEIIEIHLIDFMKKEINKDAMSKGEQQMYATVLLKALIEESGIRFPVFIDSPMQKFDVEHSSTIVQNFYPKISEQVILFPLLEKEMNKKEFDILVPNIQKTYLINNNIAYGTSKFEKVAKENLFDVFKKSQQHAI